MVQRLGALLGRADEDLQLLTCLGLADVVGQALGAQRALDGFFVGRGWGDRGAVSRLSSQLACFSSPSRLATVAAMFDRPAVSVCFRPSLPPLTLS
jgi:hypothetical protein